MELQVGIKAFIKNHEGKYLILRRIKPYEGDTKPKWDIPGGRITVGEPIFQALAREIKEETGLTMTGTPRVISAQDIIRPEQRHIVRIVCEVETEPGEVILDTHDQDTGHDDYTWATIEEIKKMYHDIYLDPVLELLNK